MCLDFAKKKILSPVTYWGHENDFTKWLAKRKNIADLERQVGMEIENIETHQRYGDLEVDIVGEDKGTGSKVIIENQFGNTDNDHLGKLGTYAAGLDAGTAIWIAEHAMEKHRKAIEWFNLHTDGQVNFFLIEVEVFQLDDSKPCVDYRVIARPSSCTRHAGTSTRYIPQTEMRETQREFWRKCQEYATEKGLKVKMNNPPTRQPNSVGFTSGFRGIRLNGSLDTRNAELRCLVYIRVEKRLLGLFDYLFENKSPIEKELKDKPEWQRDEKKIEYRMEFDIRDRESWQSAFEWLLPKVQNLHRVIPSYGIKYRKKVKAR